MAKAARRWWYAPIAEPVLAAASSCRCRSRLVLPATGAGQAGGMVRSGTGPRDAADGKARFLVLGSRPTRRPTTDHFRAGRNRLAVPAAGRRRSPADRRALGRSGRVVRSGRAVPADSRRDRRGPAGGAMTIPLARPAEPAAPPSASTAVRVEPRAARPPAGWSSASRRCRPAEPWPPSALPPVVAPPSAGGLDSRSSTPAVRVRELCGSLRRHDGAGADFTVAEPGGTSPATLPRPLVRPATAPPVPHAASSRRATSSSWPTASLFLQPSLESLLAERSLEFPFRPFPFQFEGVAFLYPRQAAILADEMGLGKTMQAITAIRLLLHRGEVRSVLLVCPKPLVTNWQREFAAWAPEVPADGRRGRSGQTPAWQWQLPDVPLRIANYELLLRDRELLELSRPACISTWSCSTNRSGSRTAPARPAKSSARSRGSGAGP